MQFHIYRHHGKAPASVNKYNKISQTPLIIAAYADNQPACLALVLHRETKLGVTDGTGKYAHHIAAELGHVDVLKVSSELLVKFICNICYSGDLGVKGGVSKYIMLKI